MRKIGIILSLAGAALLGACSRTAGTPADDALKNDLALAAQVQPYAPQQFVSPAEQRLGPDGLPMQYSASAMAPAPAPVYRAPVRSAPRRTASSTGTRRSSGGGGTYYPAPAPKRETIRHTKRDAAIGAAAGAIIGVATSRDKVKGGLIGAAAGGILGGIIGHTVDVQRP